ncbi:MFS transporter [Ramlibacter rhizophilus]|nr:MFS transporter [Ramlibacter rhizophilus]
MNAAAWRITLSAALLMALVTGSRAAGALYLSPLNSATGVGLAGLSLGLAIGQLGVGLLQPVIGALADRLGASRIVACGAVLLALFTVAPAAWPQAAPVLLALVLATLAGSAVASNALLLGPVNRTVPAARAGQAVAIVGAGASAGQLLLGPATQWAIEDWGWRSALVASGVVLVFALPLSRALRGAPCAPVRREGGAGTAGRASLRRTALRDSRFWRVAASFGLCGFHIAFLTAHMPGVIERCGLPVSLAGRWMAVSGAANVVGSLAVGALLRRSDPARLLAAVYVLRALGIGTLLVVPATPTLMLGFALAMGATHMATLPPTSQLVARDHGVQQLGALFGVVMLVHQLGSFGGVWLGGWAAAATGGDALLWRVDLGLALLAAALAWSLRPLGR